MAEATGFDVVGRTLLETATPGPWESMPNTGPYTTWIMGRTGTEGAVGWDAVRDVLCLDDEECSAGLSEADAALIAHMRSAYPVALDAIDRVHALHRPIVESDFWRACAECSDEDAEYVVAWPCPTVRALGGAS